MVDVGKLSDEPWPEPEVEPVTVQELRAACELVAQGYADLAATMTPAGELLVTSERAYELGRRLTTFGELHGRYWTAALSQRG